MSEQYIMDEIPDGIFVAKNNKERTEFENLDEKNLRKIRDHIVYPETGGILVYYRSFLYPEKGWRHPKAVVATQYCKRVMISWIRFFSSRKVIPYYLIFLFTPWKKKVNLIEFWIQQFTDSIVLLFGPWILEEQYLSPVARELRKFIIVFLTELGVNLSIAELFADIFANFINYDMAYYYRLEDIMSETNAWKLIKQPRTEIRKLVNLIAERDNTRPHMAKRFNSFGKLLSLGLLLPKIRKAFYKAVLAIDVTNMQYDEADRYWVRHKEDYKFFGMTIEERYAKWPAEYHTMIEVIKDNSFNLVNTDQHHE